MQSYGSMSQVTSTSTSALSKRTLVLIGSSGSGKSTIANKLYGYELFHRTDNYQGVTKHVRSECKQIPNSHLMLETYLMDVRPPFSLTHTHREPTKEYYREYLPDDISLIIFVCKHSSPQDLESLKRIVGFFEGRNGRAVCALVVTFCERLPPDEKRSKEEEYSIDPEKMFIGDHVKRVYCVGFNPDEERAKKKEEQASIDDIMSLIARSHHFYPKSTLLSQSVCEKVTSTCSIL